MKKDKAGKFIFRITGETKANKFIKAYKENQEEFESSKLVDAFVSKKFFGIESVKDKIRKAATKKTIKEEDPESPKQRKKTGHQYQPKTNPKPQLRPRPLINLLRRR